MNYQDELKHLFKSMQSELEHCERDLTASKNMYSMLQNENRQLIAKNEELMSMLLKSTSALEISQQNMSALKQLNQKQQEQIERLLELKKSKVEAEK